MTQSRKPAPARGRRKDGDGDGDGAGNDAARPRGSGRPRIPGLDDVILEATIELLAEQGPDEITIDTIAARAGVARPTVYLRWATKGALVQEALENIFERTFDLDPESDGIREQLVAFARFNIDAMQSPLRVLCAAFFNLEASNVATDAVERAKDRNLGIVRAGIAAGELRPDGDPFLLLETIFGVIWLRANTNRPMDPPFAEQLVDAVLDGWSPRGD